MGASKLLSALFGNRSAQILEALAFASEPVHLRELARRAGAAPIVVSRILDSLVKARLVERERKANLVLYSFGGSKEAALLKNLVVESRGLIPLLRGALERVSGIEGAFVYGSFAAGEENADSDVDVVIVGSPDYAVLAKAVNGIDARFGREVNYSVYSPKEFKEKSKAPFLKRVLTGKKLMLVGAISGIGSKRNRIEAESK